MSNIECCRTHCCVLHGCKYRDKTCPVVNRKNKQLYLCERCCDEGYNKIPNPDDPNYDLLTMTEKQLIEECKRLRSKAWELKY